MILFHGSNQIVQTPYWDKSEPTCDFGIGFYLTPDKDMAKKWACGKPGDKGVVSIYNVDLEALNTYQFSLNKEWLEFIKVNRLNLPVPDKYKQFDLLIGPTADDRLYETVSDYIKGYCSANEAIMYLNVAGFANQYVFKNQEALDRACTYLDKKVYAGHAKQLGKAQADQARIEASLKLDEVKRIMAKQREAFYEKAANTFATDSESFDGSPKMPPL